MKHKRQHFVPRSYLRAWLDPSAPKNYEPFVWVIDKSSLSAKRRAPKNILYKHEFYTTTTDKGERDLSIETALSRIEGEFVQIRDDLIARELPLGASQRVSLLVFVAAMHARTPASGERSSPFWEEVLGKMKAMQAWAATASPEQLAQSAALAPIHPRNSHVTSAEEIQRIVDAPVPTQLVPTVKAEVENLVHLDLAILRTRTSPGFITSDNPVVWFDPEGYGRPWPYQGPALIYPSIEITLSISPSQALLLNRQGTNGYVDLGVYGPKADQEVVNNANWRIRASARDMLVLNSPALLWDWFYPRRPSSRTV